MDINDLKYNPDLANNGVWVEHDETTSFLIAKLGNKGFQTAFKKRLQPYRRAYENGTLSAKKEVEIMVECMADHILLGWKGLLLNGKEIQYSREKCVEILSMEGAEEFRDLITNYSTDVANYKTEQNELDLKN
mgnify:CR=1|jgi:hypothetical protein|tara:strand:- start:269 stop:667 length:399 start_codon:yes stop_codon:yes gene_type:complete